MALWNGGHQTGCGLQLFKKATTGYVFLLPVFFLLHNYNELFGFIPLAYLLTFGSLIYLFSVVVFGIAWLITRSVAKAFFTTFCCQLFALFWGAWHDFIKSITGNSFLSSYLVLLPTALVFFTAFAWYMVKSPQRLKKIAAYLSIVLLILCALGLVNFVEKYRQYTNDHNFIYPKQPLCQSYTSCRQPDSLKPDIYFIIFDEYTNNRTLQRYWQYDNSGITNWLTQKGFYCAGSSRANYSYTPYSISSILNMNYLSIKQGDIRDLPAYTLKAVQSMSNNETFCMLKMEHYDLHFISPFNNAFANLHVDREFDGFAGKKLFDQTFPGRFIHDFAWLLKRKNYAPEILNAPERTLLKKDRDNDVVLNRIKSTVNTRCNRPPQFVYGHLMTTHSPHVYDSLGSIRTARNAWSRVPLFDTYLNQVKQANKKMQELVEYIQSHNRKNTLMIIMGDHGFRHYPDPKNLDYFPNFSAFYFPDRSYPPTLSNISAVNTFRIVFNQYFCQDLKLLKDSSIIVKY